MLTSLMCVLCQTGRRQAVSEAELAEFNTQAECLGWAKPIILSTDHGKPISKCMQSNNLLRLKNDIVGNATFTIFFPLTDYQNCEEFEPGNNATGSRISMLIFSKINNLGQEPLKCITESLLYYPRLLINLFQSFKN